MTLYPSYWEIFCGTALHPVGCGGWVGGFGQHGGWVGGLVGLDQIKIDTSLPTEVKNSDVTKSVNFTQAAQTVLKKEEDEET